MSYIRVIIAFMMKHSAPNIKGNMLCFY